MINPDGLLSPVSITHGKYRGRSGHVLQRFTHCPSGVRYLVVQVKGDPARDSLPRDISDYMKVQGAVTCTGQRRELPAWSFVVTVRQERTGLVVQP